ncbi:hypothetical protein pipiens_012937 [Culex pipiens pipiens]|uniref:Uncharacterized protein n=1 Tax=Culex pipiens pipiens TaxID=38569 RepID=A0ABD1D0E0_CULPP
MATTKILLVPELGWADFRYRLCTWVGTCFCQGVDEVSHRVGHGGFKKTFFNSNFGILTAQNGHAKGASTAEGGTTTTIGSPARRSEVSPIQNHTTSRRGWQSPNQDQLPSLSPRSDDYRQYQYQQQQQQHHQHYQLQQQQLKSPAPIYGNGTLPSGSGGGGYKLSSNGYIPNQNHQQGMSSSPRSITRDGFRTLEAGGNFSKSVDSGNFSTAMYGIKEEGYRKSSGGGGSGVISSGNVMVNTLNYSTATSSSNELLEDLQHIEANRLKRGQHAKISSSSSSSINSNNNNLVNNNSIVGNGNSNNGGLFINNNGFEQQQPSRVVCKMAPIVKHQQQVVVQQQQQHYGSGSCGAYYEQHNSINNNLVYGKHPPVPPPPIPAKSHAVTQLSKNGNRPNSNNNNNNNNGFEICTVTSGGGGKSGPTSTGSTLSTFANKFHKLTANRNSNNNSFDGKQNHVNNNNNVHHHQPQPNGHHHQHHHHHAQTTVVVGQPGQPGGGHHNTTLSSPESAYSTGYSSTDGTSPGKCRYYFLMK